MICDLYIRITINAILKGDYMPSAKLDFQRKCIVCGETFTPKTITSRCCSAKCIKAASKRKKEEERKAEEMSR